MKKWMELILIAGLTAGTASAAFWPFGNKDEKAEEQPPVLEESQHRKERPRRPGGGEERRRSRLSPEQAKRFQQMRNTHREIMEIGKAARNETDPVKQEELVGQLRDKLNQVADKMQKMHEKRLKQAEQEIGRLRERAKEMSANRDERIEEQIQKILAGERLGPPEGERGKHGGKGKRDGKGMHRELSPEE